MGLVGSRPWVDGLRPERAVAAMAHRGPDGSGLWRSPSPAAGAGERSPICVLGHTRLSILDLTEAGRQPMTTADGRHVLVYNGEVYNFTEIRRELEALGETFASTGDSEVVLKACVQWGASAIERFRGMFALGFWDERERSLLLARDRLGIKPLYMVDGPEGLAFASEVRALMAADAAPRVLSPMGLLGYMRFGSVQEPDSLVAGVRSLPPGSMLRFGRSGRRETRYWDLPSEAEGTALRPEAAEKTSILLREAVRQQLVSQVPYGVFLSGGVDSAALTAIAAGASSGPVRTLTVVFDEAKLSEETRAVEIAERFGCRHQSVRVTGSDVGRDLESALEGQDQPSGDGLNTWLVSRAARQAGLSMAISGLGGDEILAGYGHFRYFGRLLRASRVSAAIPSVILSLLGKRLASTHVPGRARKLVALAEAGGDAWNTYGALRGLFTDAQSENLMPETVFRRLVREEVDRRHTPDWARSKNTSDAVNLLTRLEVSCYLRNTLLRDTDAMSMANSLEIRVPFLDHRLLEHILSIPGCFKIAGAGNKPLLLDAVSEVPRELGLRPKAGFVLPLREWFSGPMRGTMEELLLGLPGNAAGVLRRKSTAAQWTAFLRGGGVTGSRMWALASLSSWVARFDLALPW